MNAAVLHRLRFIDFLLDAYGYFNRSMLMDWFGISQPQVSIDIRAYMEAAPINAKYCNSTKRYIRAKEFVRAFP